MKMRTRRRRLLSMTGAVVALALLGMVAGVRTESRHAAAQEGTPAATLEAQPDQPAVETARSREQVIAQGLAIFDLEPGVWRIVEIEPAPFDEAEAVTTNVSFTLQIEGVTIIRNEVTIKRARLEPGEAYFFSAGDPYLRYSLRGTASRAWVIEYVAPDSPEDEAGGTIIFESEPIDRFQPGTRDLELIRNVLLPGESAPLPAHRDPALLAVTEGTLTVTAGDASATLATANALMIPGDATLSNAGDVPATYVVVASGARVPDPGTEEEPAGEEPAEETPDETATEAPAASPTALPEPDADADGLSDTREAELGTDPANPDSDGDGTSDGDEVFITGTDPLDPNSAP